MFAIKKKIHSTVNVLSPCSCVDVVAVHVVHQAVFVVI